MERVKKNCKKKVEPKLGESETKAAGFIYTPACFQNFGATMAYSILSSLASKVTEVPSPFIFEIC